LMVVPVDKVTRAQLDLLVEAGVAETRSKAAASLLKETVQSRQEIFNKIEKTRSQIETLKQQLHTLVGSPS
jgi:predicted rRNA methylase YqxC with S4 and FtsJ domains